MTKKVTKIGNVPVGGNFPPRIVGVISEQPKYQAKLAKKELADIIELRIDMLANYDNKKNVNNIINNVRKYSNYIPIIGTIRTIEDGGKYFTKCKYSEGEKKRFELFNDYIEFLDCIDIEYRSFIRKDVCNLVHSNNKPLLVSYHNIAYTPPKQDLSDIIKKSIDDGADLIKLITLPVDKNDLQTLYSLSMENEQFPVCIFGIGLPGLSSHVISLEFGASFTYGHLGYPVVQHSLSVEEIHNEINRLLHNTLTIRTGT